MKFSAMKMPPKKKKVMPPEHDESDYDFEGSPAEEDSETPEDEAAEKQGGDDTDVSVNKDDGDEGLDMDGEEPGMETLAKASDDDLIAECEKRGLKVKK